MKSVLQKNRFFNNDFVICGDNHLFFSFFVCVLGFVGCCFLVIVSIWQIKNIIAFYGKMERCLVLCLALCLVFLATVNGGFWKGCRIRFTT